MILTELIDMLRQANPDAVLAEGFHNPHSWRGNYSELAFEPAANVTVRSMLAAAEAADGATYEGWKGGDFTMNGWSEVHLAIEGTMGEPLSPMAIKWMLSTAEQVEGVSPQLIADTIAEAFRAGILAGILAAQHTPADVPEAVLDDVFAEYFHLYATPKD